MNKNHALCVLLCKSLILAQVALLNCSCATSSRFAKPPAVVLELAHLQGTKYSCLADCVNMVLGYYEVPNVRHFAATTPLKLLDVDSLLTGIEFTRDQVSYELRGFILQEDEKFLKEQIDKQRPTILIFRATSQYYHSVVLAGMNQDENRYYIHDPAQRRGQWISRAKLLKRWKSGEHTLVMIALAAK